MCGIAGVFNGGGVTAADSETVARMSERMRRRGPDDEGAWCDGAHVAFGFRRLSILDLSEAGHQPMQSICGRHAMVYNGEVYNFRELRRELEQLGRQFRSSSDSEVVMQALAQWGSAALSRFNGMFALAWYDRQTRTLLLARDPMGIKPLYYFVAADSLAFGSQYDQIIHHPACDRSAVDPEVLGLYLRLAYMPAPYGLIRGTNQLLPGHYLTVRPGELPTVRPFYHLPAGEESRLTGATAVELVHETLRGAVARQLMSDVPLGTFLSGGVDSPLVSALATAVGGRLPAFTIGSADPVFDEGDAARAYAVQLDVEHHVRICTERDVLGLLDDVAAAYSEPFADYSAFPTLLVSALAREHVKVVLSGDGGDELFWGYPRFAKVLGARRQFQRPWALRAGAYAASRYIGRALVPRGVLFSSVGRWQFDAHSALRDEQLRRIAPTLLRLPANFTLYDHKGVDDETELGDWLRWNEIAGHLQMVLLKVDRASMYHGLEVRVPLLDLEVVEAASRVALEACISQGVGKQVLRRALARHVRPDSIPTPKRGFTIPLASWLRRELRPVVEDRLLARDPFPTGVFNRGALRALYKEHLEGRRDHTRGLWSLLSLQLWADHHLTCSSANADGAHRRRAGLATRSRVAL